MAKNDPYALLLDLPERDPLPLTEGEVWELLAHKHIEQCDQCTTEWETLVYHMYPNSGAGDIHNTLEEYRGRVEGERDARIISQPAGTGDHSHQAYTYIRAKYLDAERRAITSKGEDRRAVAYGEAFDRVAVGARKRA